MSFCEKKIIFLTLESIHFHYYITKPISTSEKTMIARNKNIEKKNLFQKFQSKLFFFKESFLFFVELFHNAVLVIEFWCLKCYLWLLITLTECQHIANGSYQIKL